jgi:hypothetical protein
MSRTVKRISHNTVTVGAAGPGNGGLVTVIPGMVYFELVPLADDRRQEFGKLFRFPAVGVIIITVMVGFFSSWPTAFRR